MHAAIKLFFIPYPKSVPCLRSFYRSSIATIHATNPASPTQFHAVTSSSFVRPFGRRARVIAVGSKKKKKSCTIKSARPCSCVRCHSLGRRDHPGDSPFVSPFFGGWRFCIPSPPCTRLAYGRPACVGECLDEAENRGSKWWSMYRISSLTWLTKHSIKEQIMMAREFRLFINTGRKDHSNDCCGLDYYFKSIIIILSRCYLLLQLLDPILVISKPCYSCYYIEFCNVFRL